jgi:hypothetical protein
VSRLSAVSVLLAAAAGWLFFSRRPAARAVSACPAWLRCSECATQPAAGWTDLTGRLTSQSPETGKAPHD